MNREEVIAALVTDKFSGFKVGDESLLAAASDERLNEFRAATDAARSASNDHTKLETDHRQTVARLKVAEDRIKASETTLTEEEFIARAPEGIKALLEADKAAKDAMKAALVSSLKELGEHTEEQLKAMGIDQLQTLASYARVTVPDFSGRGIANTQQRNAEKKVSYAPPDPYAKPLEQMRAAQAAGKH